MLAIGLASIAICCWLAYIEFDPRNGSLVRAWIGLSPIIIAIAIAAGVFMGLAVLQPNESLVCLLFGSYVGTEHRPGFWWVNPFNSKKIVSRRLETLESGPLKVNDAVGNPIDIGAVIVWRVEDAAKALLEVASYAGYVKAQSETAPATDGERAPLRSGRDRGSGEAGRTSGKRSRESRPRPRTGVDGEFARRWRRRH
ncbi:SPFH domain-containing protein [Bradyrhizobium sp. McL0615]|uniref:SPFH domain-containing protein n=1 Tax=Bradyrhizobium sp. McL0615 TaxID=3415673 RepID=UPI003CED5217